MRDGRRDLIGTIIDSVSRIFGFAVFVAVYVYSVSDLNELTGICVATFRGNIAVSPENLTVLSHPHCHSADVRIEMIKFMLFLSAGLIGWGSYRFFKGVVFWRDPDVESKT